MMVCYHRQFQLFVQVPLGLKRLQRNMKLSAMTRPSQRTRLKTNDVVLPKSMSVVSCQFYDLKIFLRLQRIPARF